MKKNISLAALALIIIISHSANSAESNTPQIWFNMTNYVMQNGVDGQQGWNKLFVDINRPWPEFMKHVQVVAAAGIWKTPDDVLIKTFAKLKQKHIPFGMESLAQSWVHEPECGHGVESYYDPPGARKVAEKIKADGGELAYIAMDEPLFFGHYYDGKNACHSSIQNAAERAAAILHEYQKVFPNVVIGDIEPVPGGIDWRNDYSRWMKAFSAAVGQPIAFIQLDINWGKSGEWANELENAVSYAHSQHLPAGIIYNADMSGGVNSDQQWLDGAMQNIKRVEGQMHIVPDQAIFHSWSKFPRQSITDENGPGEEYLVEEYLQEHGLRH